MKIKDIFRFLSIFKEFIGRKIYWIFVIAIIVSVLESLGISMLLPLLSLSDSVGNTTPDRLTQGVTTILSFLGIENAQVTILGFIVFLFIVKGFFKFLEGFYRGKLMRELLNNLTLKLFDSYFKVKYEYFISNNTGHYINVINSQTNRTVTLLKNITVVFTNAIITISYMVFALFIAWQFSLTLMAVGLLILFVFRRLNRYLLGISRNMADEYTNLNKFLVQTLHAFKYIISTGQVESFRRKVKITVGKLSGYIFNKTKWDGFTKGVQEPITIVLIVGVVVIQLYYFDKPIEPIIVALMLFYRGFRYLMSIQDSWQQTLSVAGSVEMVEKELNVLKKNESDDGKEILPDFKEHILINKISFKYQNSANNAVKDIELCIPANKTIAFVGESGSGKTTLVDILTVLLEPSDGEIFIDKLKTTQIVKDSWRKHIGYVSQDTTVFDDTVANNICLWSGNYKKDKQLMSRIENASKKAFAFEFINELSNGFETVVGERGVRLSGGQRQRLFIARELFKEPDFLILDEATSALDTRSEKFIQKSIDKLKGKLTVIIIAHRLSTIKNADIIYVLDKGEVIEKGNFDQLIQTNSRFKTMVEYQNL